MMNIEVGLSPYHEQVQQAGRHVLGFYGHPGGYEPGGFTSALLAAFQKADRQNFVKLKQAYPALGYAVDLMKNDGPDAVRKWAGI